MSLANGAPTGSFSRPTLTSISTSPTDSPRPWPPPPQVLSALSSLPAPRLPARLRGAAPPDGVGIGTKGGKVLVLRPVYAGKALQRARLEGTPAIVSLRPNTDPPRQSGDARSSVH